ncbi:hypothetical protein WA026_005275 [Henosepilachna vigintioctopunctata]|uniref:Uncharacterized protein n=1 Tax=Henosepilachna vigintioctopunctata TaxID=420089 RepID=A0AAW1UTF9_9CUCU
MDELEEKTRVLDTTISLLKDSQGIFEKDVAIVSMRGQSSSIDVKNSRNCELLLENNNIPDLDSTNKDTMKTDSEICMSNGDNKCSQEIVDSALSELNN